jgi:hypothetical protein
MIKNIKNQKIFFPVRTSVPASLKILERYNIRKETPEEELKKRAENKYTKKITLLRISKDFVQKGLQDDEFYTLIADGLEVAKKIGEDIKKEIIPLAETVDIESDIINNKKEMDNNAAEEISRIQTKKNAGQNKNFLNSQKPIKYKKLSSDISKKNDTYRELIEE